MDVLRVHFHSDALWVCGFPTPITEEILPFTFHILGMVVNKPKFASNVERQGHPKSANDQVTVIRPSSHVTPLHHPNTHVTKQRPRNKRKMSNLMLPRVLPRFPPITTAQVESVE